jgi:flavin reductase (DIM6/NTAB) family NADH-FMN oxidoreductase RutF
VGDKQPEGKPAEPSPAARLAMPVALITAAEGGHRYIVVGSAAYASLEPLMLSTALVSESATARAIAATGRFGICLAGLGQSEIVFALSRQPAAALSAAERFAALALVPELFPGTGTPYLADAPDSFDLTVVSATRTGNCTMFVGTIAAMAGASGGTVDGINNSPLLRFARTYGTFERIAYPGDDYPV